MRLNDFFGPDAGVSEQRIGKGISQKLRASLMIGALVMGVTGCATTPTSSLTPQGSDFDKVAMDVGQSIVDDLKSQSPETIKTAIDAANFDAILDGIGAENRVSTEGVRSIAADLIDRESFKDGRVEFIEANEDRAIRDFTQGYDILHGNLDHYQVQERVGSLIDHTDQALKNQIKSMANQEVSETVFISGLVKGIEGEINKMVEQNPDIPRTIWEASAVNYLHDVTGAFETLQDVTRNQYKTDPDVFFSGPDTLDEIARPGQVVNAQAFSEKIAKKKAEKQHDYQIIDEINLDWEGP